MVVPKCLREQFCGTIRETSRYSCYLTIGTTAFQILQNKKTFTAETVDGNAVFAYAFQVSLSLCVKVFEGSARGTFFKKFLSHSPQSVASFTLSVTVACNYDTIPRKRERLFVIEALVIFNAASQLHLIHRLRRHLSRCGSVTLAF